MVWAVMCVFKRSSAYPLYPPLFFRPISLVTLLCRRRCLFFIQTLSRPPLILRTERRLWKALTWGRHWRFALKCRRASILTMGLAVKAPEFWKTATGDAGLPVHHQCEQPSAGLVWKACMFVAKVIFNFAPRQSVHACLIPSSGTSS